MSAWRIIEGDALERLREMEAESIDAIVTDPPYALTARKQGGSGQASVNLESPYGRARIGTGNGAGGFMGQRWDAEIPGVDVWTAALRVAKPGAHLLAFGGTRTFHRLTCALEDAGWEIRDCLSWLYGQGFPKSLDVSKAIDREAGVERAAEPVTDAAREWGGWGTALKPAWEPIILARKPPRGTIAENVQAHGTGALNVDACRIVTDDTIEQSGEREDMPRAAIHPGYDRPGATMFRTGKPKERSGPADPLGRWPANVVLDEEAARMLDEQSGERTSGLMRAGQQRSQGGGYHGNFPSEATAHDTYADTGGASRFFYCPKADRAERNAGLDGPERSLNWSSGDQSPGTFQSEGTHRAARNFHPTVKPLALMAWLCRLVAPPGGIVLDPFCGSGSTGIAALREGFSFIGIEREPDYCALARRRIAEDAPLLNGGR